MLARDIMTPDVITATPATPLAELVHTMLERRISALPVLDGAALVGIVSEGDLLRRPERGTVPQRPRWLWLRAGGAARDAAAYTQAHGRTAAEVMSRPVVSIAEGAPVEALAATMERERIKRLPVLRDGRLVGIITRADLLRALALRLAAPDGTPNEADDGRIRAALLTEIAAQPWAPASGEVGVLVHGGVVHLFGAVDSEAQRSALIAAAESTAGVRSVTDQLNLRHPADPMDRPNWLTTPPA